MAEKNEKEAWDRTKTVDERLLLPKSKVKEEFYDVFINAQKSAQFIVQSAQFIMNIPCGQESWTQKCVTTSN